VYGSDNTPAPIALEINVNILPLIEPAAKGPNILLHKDLSSIKYNYISILKLT